MSDAIVRLMAFRAASQDYAADSTRTGDPASGEYEAQSEIHGLDLDPSRHDLFDSEYRRILSRLSGVITWHVIGASRKQAFVAPYVITVDVVREGLVHIWIQRDGAECAQETWCGVDLTQATEGAEKRARAGIW